MIRRGFTLIELLVVISIISLLVSILLPALGSARASAQNVQCLSNGRQIATSSIAYSSDYNEYLPNFYEEYTGAPQYDAAASFNSMAWRIDNFMAGTAREMFRCPSYTAYPGRTYFISGTDDTFQGWVHGSATAVGPNVNARLYKSDWGLPYLGFNEVRNTAAQPYMRMNNLLTRAYTFKSIERSPLAVEARNLGPYAKATSLNYMQWGSASDWNRMVVGTSDPEALGASAHSGTYFFSTLHMNGSNIPMADGHVEHFDRDTFLSDKPY